MTSDEHDVTPVHGEDEILERVHKRGTQLRRRKRLARASAATTIAIVVLAGSLAVAHIGGTKHQSQGFVNPSVTDSPTPTDAPSDTPTPDVSPSESPSEQPSVTEVPTVFPMIAPCINSYDSTCGAFYWDPAPGPDAPMTVTGSASSKTVAVGETVTVQVTAVDPDAEISCHKIEWGPTAIGFAITALAKYGRWETPAKTRGEVTETYTHAYDQPGTYQVMFSVMSGNCGRPDLNPYSDSGGWGTTITVTAAPSPSPSDTSTPSPSPSDSASPSPSPSP